MSVDLDHARRIAALARLRFDGEELTRITQELNQVLDHVQVLQNLEESVAGDADPLETEGDPTRGSEAESPDALGAGLEELAPDSRDGFFLVPPLPGVHAEDVE